MSKTEAIIIKGSRPKKHRGKIDRYLAKVAFELRRLMLKEQQNFEFKTCQLAPDQASNLAAICVEFAEDIHCDLGLWKALEFFNREFFDTPLPFLIEPGSIAGDDLKRFDSRRIQHLIWRMIPYLKASDTQNFVISPTHNDLETLAVLISEFLQDQFATMPTDSSVRQLLADENTEAHNVKRKLVWLGNQSYLFRYFFDDYFSQHSTGNQKEDFNVIDDYVCQECSLWSGLGALEILAEILQFKGSDREDLLSWNHRYLAVYEVLDLDMKGKNIEDLHTRNVINDQEYVIHMELPYHKAFQKGSYVLGSITCWRGIWGWSGTQRPLGNKLSADKLGGLRDNFFRTKAQITYRYCPDRLEAAIKHAAKVHADFVDFHGSEMPVFEDGHAMAEAEQSRVNKNRGISKKLLKKLIKNGKVEIEYPQYLLDDTSVAVFSDPVEGCTVFSGVDEIEAWLTGQSDNSEKLHAMLSCTETPPSAILLLIEKYGGEEFAKMLKIEGQPLDLVIEYALRSQKGEFFRKRFPNVAVV